MAYSNTNSAPLSNEECFQEICSILEAIKRGAINGVIKRNQTNNLGQFVATAAAAIPTIAKLFGSLFGGSGVTSEQRDQEFDAMGKAIINQLQRQLEQLPANRQDLVQRFYDLIAKREMREPTDGPKPRLVRTTQEIFELLPHQAALDGMQIIKSWQPGQFYSRHPSRSVGTVRAIRKGAKQGIARRAPISAPVAVQPVVTAVSPTPFVPPPAIQPVPVSPSPTPSGIPSCPTGFRYDTASGFCLPIDTGQMPLTFVDPATGQPIAPSTVPVTEAGVIPAMGGMGMMLLIGGGLALAVFAGGKERKPKRHVRKR